MLHISILNRLFFHHVKDAETRIDAATASKSAPGLPRGSKNAPGVPQSTKGGLGRAQGTPCKALPMRSREKLKKGKDRKMRAATFGR